MILPAWQQLNSSESQEAQEKNTNSSSSPQQFFTNALPMEKMSLSQILSYLSPHSSDSGGVKDYDLYDTLKKNTISADPSVKSFSFIDQEQRNVIFHGNFKEKSLHNAFISLQKWEGVVLKVIRDGFLARLIDLTNTGTDEEAEFPIDEISEEDKPLVRPGAIFYWNIGYHTSYSGQRTRISLIRFRRLPAWTQREIDAAKREAERIGKELGWQ